MRDLLEDLGPAGILIAAALSALLLALVGFLLWAGATGQPGGSQPGITYFAPVPPAYGVTSGTGYGPGRSSAGVSVSVPEEDPAEPVEDPEDP